MNIHSLVCTWLIAALFFLFVAVVSAQELTPGKVTDLVFSDASLPPTLHAMMTHQGVTPTMTVRLPDDYDSSKTYPLLVRWRGEREHRQRANNCREPWLDCRECPFV